MKRLSISLLLAASATSFASERVPMPDDWEAGVVLRDTNHFAYPIHEKGPPDPDDPTWSPVVATTIVQRRGEVEVSTRLPGKSRPYRYSPSGERLLVSQIPPDAGRCCTCPSQTVILDADGAIVNELGYRNLGLSSDGSRLVRSEGCGGPRCSGRDILLFDLDGRQVRRVETGDYERSVVVEDGRQIVLLDDAGLRAIDADGQLLWGRALERGALSTQWRLVPPNRIALSLRPGRLMVIDFDGVVHFDRTSGATAGGFGAVFEDRLLVDWRRETWMLDVAAGSWERVLVDLEPPEGFELRHPHAQPLVSGGHLVFRGKGEVAFRPFLDAVSTETVP